MSTDITWDIEASGLLDDSTIDYTTIPYKLKPSFKLHVIAVEEWDTGRVLCFHNGPKFTFDGSVIAYTLDGVAKTLHGYDPVDYVHYPLDKFPAYIRHMVKHKKLGRVWGHNQINYDLMAADLYFDMPFDTDKSLWCGMKTGGFEDSYVRSKVQNADRFGGHGLENVAKAAGGFQKYDFRPGMKGADKFKEFGPDMVYYNILDVKSNTSVAKYLLEEAGTWDWTPALHLERVVAEIVTRQSHRGFQFNKQQAESNLEFLDKALQERQDTINPVLPPKPSTKGYQKDFTPPKKQFKGNGDMSALMEKFIEKIGAELVTGEQLAIKYKGSTYPLPLDVEVFPAAVAGSVEASVDDSTHIKGWLVSAFDWNPTEWKERDLSLDTKRKKLSPERVAENIDRYVTQTLSSPFKKHRLEYLECTENNLREKLLRIKEGKPVRVRTNPSLTIGQEKEVDPALAELSDRFPHTQQLIEYYTFKHRRNSILGGGLEYDDEEGIQEAEKGYLAAVRADGRIPTPADTCGAASGRMKHKLVANIPRSTSLFGHEMRALFGVSPDDFVYQVGYDFASLEAGIESHYCVPMTTKALTRSGWKTYSQLIVGEEILAYNPDTNQKEWTPLRGLVKYEGSKTYTIKAGRQKYRATADHRWYVRQRKTKGGNYEHQARTTANLNTATQIICNAPFNMHQDLESNNKLSAGKYDVDWVSKVVNMSQKERVSFLEGFMIADGYWHVHKQKPVWRWAQNDGALFEAALTASYLVHDGCVTVGNNGGKGKVKVATLGIRDFFSGQGMTIEEFGVEDVWCPQTDLKTWVMRQEDCITITGNCWKYDLEDGKPYCNSLLQEKPHDVHTITATKISELINKAFPRSSAKAVKYASTYGAQAAKIAKTIGADLELGHLVFDAFWEAAKPLARLKEDLTKQWELTGKKYVVGLDGRKIPTRAAHSILNSLFQSGGVICAKRVMVEAWRIFKKKGWDVDFFREDWRMKEFVQQLIAYHDEAQAELSKTLVKWTKFDSEVEAKAFISEQKQLGVYYGQPSEKGGKFYVGYSEVTQIIWDCVNKVSGDLKLNVPLAIEFVFGLSWADCH